MSTGSGQIKRGRSTISLKTFVNGVFSKMMGKRRANISRELENEVKRRLEAGETPKDIEKSLWGTKYQISKSSVYTIKRRMAQQPHVDMLRKLTRDWLNEIREVNPIKLTVPLIEPIFSASQLLRMTKLLQERTIDSLKAEPSHDFGTPEEQEAQRWRAQVEKILTSPS